MKVFRISGRDLASSAATVRMPSSLNESLPHKRKRHLGSQIELHCVVKASMKVFRISGRDVVSVGCRTNPFAASMKVFRISGRDF